jgi:hypothetical protein
MCEDVAAALVPPRLLVPVSGHWWVPPVYFARLLEAEISLIGLLVCIPSDAAPVVSLASS